MLKPLSSGMVIGSGGPFGAEGPVIMTGGALASLLAQAFHLTSAERKAHETCRAVASRLASMGLERMPVVESEESLTVVGVVSRSDLLKPAKQLHEEESRRERFLR